MARKVFSQRFTVQGSGQFPVDMLRYDSCHPRQSEDAVSMFVDHRDDEYHSQRSIELLNYAEKGWTPTVGRWNSFGWTVVKHEQAHCIND